MSIKDPDIDACTIRETLIFEKDINASESNVSRYKEINVSTNNGHNNLYGPEC